MKLCDLKAMMGMMMGMQAAMQSGSEADATPTIKSEDKHATWRKCRCHMVSQHHDSDDSDGRLLCYNKSLSATFCTLIGS